MTEKAEALETLAQDIEELAAGESNDTGMQRALKSIVVRVQHIAAQPGDRCVYKTRYDRGMRESLR